VLDLVERGAILLPETAHQYGFGRFIDRVFSDEEVLKFPRSKVLDEVYSRLKRSEVKVSV